MARITYFVVNPPCQARFTDPFGDGEYKKEDAENPYEFAMEVRRSLNG